MLIHSTIAKYLLNGNILISLFQFALISNANGFIPGNNNKHGKSIISNANDFIGNNNNNKHGKSNLNKRWAIQQRSPIIEEITDNHDNIMKIKPTCQYCNQIFLSRNSLFRHIRNDVNCSQHFSFKELKQTPTTHSIALLVGYDTVQNDKSLDLSESEIIHSMVTKSFENITAQTMDEGAKVISVTQATAARHRHSLLQQERGCASIGDIVVVNYLSSDSNPNNVSEISNNLNNLLDKEWSMYEMLGSNTEAGIKRNYVPPYILAAKPIAPKSKSSHLHAERLCTQRIYHYLLPLDWLPDGANIKNWRSNSTKSNSEKFSSWYKPYHQSHDTPVPDALRLLKKALSHAKSPTTKSNKTSSGRFGLLSNKERRCFHNFANPNLQGSASPNHETVWLALDRVSIVSFQTFDINNKKHGVAIIEFSGDGFLPEQIRRIIGTAIAVVNKWIPESFFDYALRSDVIIDTPMAPEGRLYFSEARYHFEEMYYKGESIIHQRTNSHLVEKMYWQKKLKQAIHICLIRTLCELVNLSSSIWLTLFIVITSKGKSFFENEEWNAQKEYAEQLHKTLLNRRALPETMKNEEDWLHSLQYTVAPCITKRMNKAISASSLSNILTKPIVTNVVPHPYNHVLSLLRNLLLHQSWPITSIARSRVLKENDVLDPLSSSGSFTVINPELLSEFQQLSIPVPKNNALFPELARAVFELELKLSEKTNRPPSTHCAINCNAQFILHVDSGRGKGQSLSMIVGLGLYDGGQIVVEGVDYDIRYQPLEFDGWKQRHWTNRFEGERFSLVWFTPES